MALPLPGPAEVEDLVGRLRADGLDAVWVDRAPVYDKVTLLHALYQALSLPGHFGFNWDALEDALFGPEDPESPPRLLVFRDFELLEEREPATARVFLDIVRTVADNPASTLAGMLRAHGAPEPPAPNPMEDE
jgi:RNAse (barnase) inhibitor barstar